MQTSMMQIFLLNTYRSFLDVLKNHSASLPDDASLDNDLIDVVLEPPLLRTQV